MRREHIRSAAARFSGQPFSLGAASSFPHFPSHDPSEDGIMKLGNSKQTREACCIVALSFVMSTPQARLSPATLNIALDFLEERHATPATKNEWLVRF